MLDFQDDVRFETQSLSYRSRQKRSLPTRKAGVEAQREGK